MKRPDPAYTMSICTEHAAPHRTQDFRGHRHDPPEGARAIVDSGKILGGHQRLCLLRDPAAAYEVGGYLSMRPRSLSIR